MALEQGRLAEFKGKTLDEISIDPEGTNYYFLHVLLCSNWNMSELNGLHSAFTNGHSLTLHPFFQSTTNSQRMCSLTATLRWCVS